jgi:hypothetical protein
LRPAARDTVSVSPGCAFVSDATSLGERIGLPSTARIRSPLTSPARSAGLPGSTWSTIGAPRSARKPERRQRVALPVFGAEAGDRQFAADRLAVEVVANERKRDAIVALRANDAPAQFLPAADRLAIDAHHAIAGAHVRSGGGRRRRRLGQQRALSRHAGNERSREQQHRKQQVGERTGGDDRNAAPYRLTIERARQVGRRDVALALVRHLHVSASGIADSAHSVWSRPKRRDHTSRPNPTENRSTLTPARRAIT